MQVDFEKAITRLTERWEELTEGEKPIFVEITAYWPRDQKRLKEGCRNSMKGWKCITTYRCSESSTNWASTCGT